jgi:hypothetical protein
MRSSKRLAVHSRREFIGFIPRPEVSTVNERSTGPCFTLIRARPPEPSQQCVRAQSSLALRLCPRLAHKGYGLLETGGPCAAGLLYGDPAVEAAVLHN